MPQTEQKFISESITPVLADTGTDFMVSGGPAFPREFVWRGKPLTITSLIRTWDETGPCTHGSGERYVRKHWFEVETGSHQKAKIYFERRPRDRKLMKRWWLFSIEEDAGHAGC